ncbi:MAG: hypothetical protein JW838_05260 [Spirochaetes bacterium]|nr:hypothetical protein [Spirochaetota bacterium]
MKHCGVLALALAALLLSCSKYSITKEIQHGALLSKFKNSGILFRNTHNSPISNDRLNASLIQWLGGYELKNSLKVIENAPENIAICKSEFDRFVQFSEKDDLLYQKTRGIINRYLNENREDLEALFDEHGLDSLVIYEIDTAMSAELQFLDFGSMMLIIDREYRIAYMDHQFNRYNTNEYDREVMQDNLLDQVNGRFLELMQKLDYVKNKK